LFKTGTSRNSLTGDEADSQPDLNVTLLPYHNVNAMMLALQQ